MGLDLVVVLAGLGFVIAAVNAAIRVLFAMGRERALPGALARLSGRQTPVVAIGFLAALTLALGLPLTYADGGGPATGYLFAAGGLAVVLVYLAGNLAVIRAFRTEFRDQFHVVPHLVIPAVAVVIFLFPLWGIIHPGDYTLVNLLPFVALGWLALGIIAVSVLRARRPAIFQALGKGVMAGEGQPAEDGPRHQPPRSLTHSARVGTINTGTSSAFRWPGRTEPCDERTLRRGDVVTLVPPLTRSSCWMLTCCCPGRRNTTQTWAPGADWRPDPGRSDPLISSAGAPCR